MFIVAYCVITEDCDQLKVDGPKFHEHCNTEDEAKILAKKLANSSTKDVILPKIYMMNDGETIKDAMVLVRDQWYSKISQRIKETYETVTRDQNNVVIPFQDIDINKAIKFSIF